MSAQMTPNWLGPNASGEYSPILMRSFFMEEDEKELWSAFQMNAFFSSMVFLTREVLMAGSNSG